MIHGEKGSRFYDRPLWVQWLAAVVMALVGLLVMVTMIDLFSRWPATGILWWLYVPLGQFLNTPLFRLTGIYRYYSPMLIGYMANEKRIDLHSGGSFDYLLLLRSIRPGLPVRQRLLAWHLQGLLYLITEIEQGRLPETVEVSGTSYFFNHHSMKALGFRLEEPGWFYRLNLLVNALDLIWMYSLARGKWAIPQLGKAQKAITTGAVLVQQKEKIAELHRQLEGRLQ
jgi:hypothetical protein